MPADPPGFDPQGGDLIFVVGLPGSEVIRVGEALARRAGIGFVEERDSRQPRSAPVRPRPHCAATFDSATERLRSRIVTAARTALRRQPSRAPALEIVIALPQAHAFVEALAVVFPAARFVIVVRNPVATLVGLFAEESGQTNGRLEADAHQFVALRAGFGALSRAAVMLGDAAVIVRCEDFAADPPEVSDRALAALGVINGACPAVIAPIGLDDAWMAVAGSEPLRRIALDYVDALGDDLLAALGYDATLLRAVCRGGNTALAANCECAERAAENGDLDRAEAAFREILDGEPASLRALNGLGSVLFNRLRLVEAVGVFEQAVAIAPDDPESLHNLAAALAATGREAERSQLLRRLESRRGNRPAAVS